MRGFCGGARDTCGLGEVVTNDAEIVGAPEIAGRGGVVASGDDSRAGQDEAGHGWDRATESDEHALKAREDAFAAGAVLAHDDRSGFAEPKRGSFVESQCVPVPKRKPSARASAARSCGSITEVRANGVASASGASVSISTVARRAR